ncbi:hypothetical protein J14TS2_51400 [Bacillus sp. J14TS2]|uniref:hypothetical protein n=1 Tax=Bacillus sp. J14TS2 TaxID=2807188 RepID=UPI001B0629A9|nr:hypothetical protein [Bacillus sp. J14TS2]GIN74665.1 hypothetical protein J14TS2_51400 [Bacillus sp. J14TS2]
MIKKYVKFGVIFFVLITILKWLFSSEIHWLENIGLSIGITLVIIFLDWTEKPYEYKKRK